MPAHTLHTSFAFTLRQLQYVAAVAAHQSFRRAAHACAVSQPSLSAQVAAVEAALGVILFERTNKRVLLTQEGARLLPAIHHALDAASALVALAAATPGPLVGTRTLGVLPTVAPYLLPRATPAVHAAFPSLVCAWVEGQTTALLSALAAGALDAAIAALDTLDGPLDWVELGEDPFLLCLPPSVPPPPHPALDALSTPLLLLEEGHCLRAQALAACQGAPAREQPFRATSLTTLVQMVAAGVGATLLPALAAGVEASRADVRLYPLPAPPPGRTLALAWRRGSPLAPAMEALGAALRPCVAAGVAAGLSCA